MVAVSITVAMIAWCALELFGLTLFYETHNHCVTSMNFTFVGAILEKIQFI